MDLARAGWFEIRKSKQDPADNPFGWPSIECVKWKPSLRG